jgi:hypothetical protein
MALVMVGGAVVLTTAVAPTAAFADEITFQDSNVINVGGAFANSGGNTATGNTSTNIALTGQGAAGGLASNNATTSNTSTGTAGITTGAATASGSVASNDVDQAVYGPADPDGLTIGVQDNDTVNIGVAVSNSGENTTVGNESENLAATGQGAVGGLASNSADTTNASGGVAAINAGAATANGAVADNDIYQGIASGVDDGIAVLVQDADVINIGIGIANSGGNSATGNTSTNIALTGQGAAGLVALNNATTGNASTGTGTITTGVATAVGTLAANAVNQKIHGPDGNLLAVMFQDALAANIGLGAAESGDNTVTGNNSQNLGVIGQGLAGLIASNVAENLNAADGIGFIGTGAASGKGNEAANDITQNS